MNMEEFNKTFWDSIPLGATIGGVAAIIVTILLWLGGSG